MLNGPTLNWAQFFRDADMIERRARSAGIPREHARNLGEQLAARPPRAAVERLRRQCDRVLEGMAPEPAVSPPPTPERGQRALRSLGTAGADAERVVSAHRWLRARTPSSTPPLDLIRVLEMEHQGYAVKDTIFLNPTAPLFTDFGDAGRAVLMYHEGYHLQFPDASEREVMQASWCFALAHGNEALVAAVREAMATS